MGRRGDVGLVVALATALCAATACQLWAERRGDSSGEAPKASSSPGAQSATPAAAASPPERTAANSPAEAAATPAPEPAADDSDVTNQGTASSAPVPGESTEDIPPILVDAVRRMVSYHHPEGGPRNSKGERAPPRPEYIRRAQRDAANSRNKKYDWFREKFEEFDRFWVDYEARSKRVAAAVETAAELEKAGKLAEARVALEAVITMVPADDAGKIPTRRTQTLEVRDAELDAINAYIGVLAAQKDRRALVEAGRHLYTRRRVVGSRDDERWVWLFGEARKHARARRTAPYWLSSSIAFESGCEAQRCGDPCDPLCELFQRAESTLYPLGGSEGSTMAYVFTRSTLRSEYDIPRYWISESGPKKGDWILLEPSPSVTEMNVDGKRVTTAVTLEWLERVRCWTSEEIEGWDSYDRPVYKEKCSYKEKSRKVTLDAKLADPVPDWAAKRKRFALVGRVVKPGPNWKIADAVVVDLRYLD